MGLKRVCKVAVTCLLYSVLLVFILKIVASLIAEYLLKNNDAIATLATGTLAIVIPLVLTLGVNFVLKKAMNRTLADVFMSPWAFIFTLILVLGLCYHFNDGFGKNGIYTLLLVIGLFLSYKGMSKKRAKFHEECIEKKKEDKIAKKKAKKEAKLEKKKSKPE